MRRDQLPPHPTATYVMPAYKAVYVSVPKAACTSLKWLVAGVQGEDPQRFHRSVSREVARSLTIHRRGMWRHTPMLHALTDEQLAEVDDSWFVFAVVRHPAARVWSAWQSKFLLREPRWVDEYGANDWIPRVPGSTTDVLDDFGRFTASIAADPAQPVMRNRHFMPQRDLLVPDRTPYRRIYETREIPQLLDDLAAHLRAHGWEGSELTLPRANETPLAPLAAAFAPDVLAGIEQVYEADFETFGYAKGMPPKTEPAETYDDAVLAEVGRLVERSERIGDLALRAQALAQENKRLRAHPPAPAAPPSVLRRVRRRLTHR
jgi:hypothetical protein